LENATGKHPLPMPAKTAKTEPRQRLAGVAQLAEQPICNPLFLPGFPQFSGHRRQCISSEYVHARQWVAHRFGKQE
jgi:hypothetical protein